MSALTAAANEEDGDMIDALRARVAKLEKAGQQALEAVEADLQLFNIPTTARLLEAIKALRGALETGQQTTTEDSSVVQDELVAWIDPAWLPSSENCIYPRLWGAQKESRQIPLYTRPQLAIPHGWRLVPTQITEEMSDAWVNADGPHWQDSWEALLAAVAPLYQSDEARQMGLQDDIDTARAIERAHGIKEES